MAINLNGWRALGAAVLTALPQSLPTLFPQVANIANSVALIRIQSHETNGNGTYVYIGDGDMSDVSKAGYVLLGPLQVFDIENQNAQNTLDLDQVYVMCSVNGEKIRVSCLGA